MEPISEEEQQTIVSTDAAAIMMAAGNDVECELDTSRSSRDKELAIQKLLKIVDDNEIIIDDHLRRAILGKSDRRYTSHDADESMRRSLSLSSSFTSDRRRRQSSSSSSSSQGGGSFINRSRRQLGSIILHRRNNKHHSASSSSIESTEMPSETDSSVSAGTSTR